MPNAVHGTTPCEDSRSMANDVLRRFGALTLRAASASLGHVPAPGRALPAPPVPLSSVPVSQPTPLDWTADWLIHAQLPELKLDDAKRIVCGVLERSRRHKRLTPWEAEILTAWRETCSQWAVEMAEEGR